MRVFVFLSAAAMLSSFPPLAQNYPQKALGAAHEQENIPGSRQSLFRHATFHHAWAAAQTNQRPVLLYVTSDNCLYCKKMLRQTLAHPQISAVIAEHAETFAFNATRSPELAQRLGVRGFPTTLVISPERELLCEIEGFVDPQEFAKRVWPVFEESDAARQIARDGGDEHAAVFRN